MMNRGIVSDSIGQFYNRLACALYADKVLLEKVNHDLNVYINSIQELYEPIDKYSLEDLAEVYSFYHFNRTYISQANDLDDIFTKTETLILNHKSFLNSASLVPEYLDLWSIRQYI